MIGAPVDSVRTPRLLEARMVRAGIDVQVDVMHVEGDDLDAFMRDAAGDPAIDGMLVTMPHKRHVLPYLDGMSTTALQIGSVNAVKRVASGALVGAQFDGIALVRALAEAGRDIGGARIALAGFGGAGRAIAHAILARGCGHLAVRDPAMSHGKVAAELRRLAAGSADTDIDAVGDGAAGDAATGFDILINATPLGMTKSDPSPFSAEQVAAADCVADIVSDPPATRLASLAEQAGTTLVTGRDMVAGQIGPIFDWLTNEDVEQ